MFGRSSDYALAPRHRGYVSPYFHNWMDPLSVFDDDFDQSRRGLMPFSDLTTQMGAPFRNWTHHNAGNITTERKDNGDLLIKAQLTGVNRDDIKLDLIEDDNGMSVLTFKADKREEHTQEDRQGGSFTRHSQFQIMRTIPLGVKVSSDKINADLADDMLVIEVEYPTDAYGKPASRIDIGSSRRQLSGGEAQKQGVKTSQKEQEKVGVGQKRGKTGKSKDAMETEGGQQRTQVST